MVIADDYDAREPSVVEKGAECRCDVGHLASRHRVRGVIAIGVFRLVLDWSSGLGKPVDWMGYMKLTWIEIAQGVKPLLANPWTDLYR